MVWSVSTYSWILNQIPAEPGSFQAEQQTGSSNTVRVILVASTSDHGGSVVSAAVLCEPRLQQERQPFVKLYVGVHFLWWTLKKVAVENIYIKKTIIQNKQTEHKQRNLWAEASKVLDGFLLLFKKETEK